MLPLLRRLENGQEHNFGDLVADLVEEFGLTSEEVSQLLPSGRYPLFRNRVGWASTYLVKALLIERPRRGYMVIASRGKQVLEESPERIDATYLSRFPEWRAFQGRTDKTETEKDHTCTRCRCHVH